MSAPCEQLRREVGDRLRMYRARMRMTQPMTADRAGISVGTLAKWEAGESFPRADLLVRLCEVIEVDPTRVLMGRAWESTP